MNQSLTRFHNSLYLTQPKTWVLKEGETLVVKKNREVLATIPIHHLASVVCLAAVNVTAEAMALCMRNQVSLSFLSFGGRFLGRVEGPVSGNVLLRKRQYRLAEQGWSDGPRTMLLGKIRNARLLLQRSARSGSARDRALAEPIRGLKRMEKKLEEPSSLESLRGIEGGAAHIYFGSFDRMLTSRTLKLEYRSRRPPHNPVNAMLSFGYGLLRAECVGALETVGLDPAVGFLHVDRPGRPSLALDLMEEFRPARVDRFVVALVNRGQVRKRDFLQHPNGAVEMKEAFRKSFLKAWQARKQETAVHPFLDQKASQAMLVHLQARLLARTLRGDLDHYPPYLIR